MPGSTPLWPTSATTLTRIDLREKLREPKGGFPTLGLQALVKGELYGSAVAFEPGEQPRAYAGISDSEGFTVYRFDPYSSGAADPR